MSGASKTNSPLVLYAEGVDPEADLVLVCGQRKFFVRRAVCDAFKVVESMPDKSSGAEFDVLGHSAGTLEKLLLLVDPDGVIALTPKLIRHVAPLASTLHRHEDSPEVRNDAKEDDGPDQLTVVLARSVLGVEPLLAVAKS